MITNWKARTSRIRFTSLWAISSMAGYVVGWYLLSELLGRIDSDSEMLFLALSTVLGGVAGTAQMIALWSRVSWAYQWVLVSVIAFPFAFLTSDFVHESVPSFPADFPVSWVAPGLVFGAVVGVFQWRLLAHHLGNAAIWVIANVLAFGLGRAMFVGLMFGLESVDVVDHGDRGGIVFLSSTVIQFGLPPASLGLVMNKLLPAKPREHVE